MNRLERWSLLLLFYSFVLSCFRHSLWCGWGEACILLGLFENVILLLFFIPMFAIHKAIVGPQESFSKPIYYYLANLPLGIWFVYVSICNAMKIFELTSLYF